MTLLTFQGVRAATPSRSPRRGLLALLAQEWTYWLARRDLAHLDNAALHDIGVGRSEIDDAVRHGRRVLRRG